MASKGPKTGSGKPAVAKAAARAKAAPKVPFAAPAAEEKSVPVVEAVLPPVTLEPVVVAEAAPQEVVEVMAEAPAQVVEAAVESVQPEAVAPVIETVTEAVESAIPAAVKESSIMENIETNVAKAQAFFADFNERAKAAVEKSTQLVAEANEFAKGNVEALVESGKIATTGMQAFGQDAADYGRKSFETATAALKGMSAVKSPTEFFKLQSDFFRTSFDSYVAEASKNTEALIKLAGDAAQPLSSRVALAAEKAKIAA